ncbi:MAG TPA: Ig-like domain-containing protein [Terriglobales bacterium]|nr:Ig-like domain-containing protein [Terriglobales bacterium]
MSESTLTSVQSASPNSYALTRSTPLVTASTPPYDFARDKKIFASFSTAMDSSTINANTFKVAGVTGSVSYDRVNRIAYFNPSAPLAANTQFKATLSTEVKSATGVPLPFETKFAFETRDTGNISVPGVFLPGLCVPVDALRVRFSEDMDSTTINTTTFFVAGVTGSVTYDATTHIATFTPTGGFAANTTFNATLTTGIKDLSGTAIAEDIHFTFTTCGEGEGGVGGKKLCTGNGVVWHLNAHLNLLLKEHYGDVLGGFVMVGLSGGNHAKWDVHGLAALDSFLNHETDQDVIDPGQLDGIYTNLVEWPNHLNLKGDLAVEAAALNLNIMLGGFDSGDDYGHLVVSGMNNGLDGHDIASVRAIVNTFISTGQLPAGVKPKDMLHLVKNINLAFHDCKPSDWAKTHLVVVANIN